MDTGFNRAKLLRLLNTQGKEYSFTAAGKNDFGEPSGETVAVAVRGVYHETQGYVTLSGLEGATIKSKPQSLLLCLLEDCSDIKAGMSVTINGKLYNLTDVRDVGGLGFAADLSLEVVLSG